MTKRRRTSELWPGGRKAVIDGGRVETVADDASGAVEYWVCPRVDEHRSDPPYRLSTCARCGAAITYRATARALAATTPTAKKVCEPCIRTLSEETP